MQQQAQGHTCKHEKETSNERRSRILYVLWRRGSLNSSAANEVHRCSRFERSSFRAVTPWFFTKLEKTFRYMKMSTCIRNSLYATSCKDMFDKQNKHLVSDCRCRVQGLSIDHVCMKRCFVKRRQQRAQPQCMLPDA